jgi:hypothetical protein
MKCWWAAPDIEGAFLLVWEGSILPSPQPELLPTADEIPAFEYLAAVIIQVLQKRLSQVSVVISERFHPRPTPLFSLLPFLAHM